MAIVLNKSSQIIGGDLSPELLASAYRRGIFPWYQAGQPVLWWSPDPRMVLFPSAIRISSSMSKLLRKQLYKITIDSCFTRVIKACSGIGKQREETWITQQMIDAYSQLHDLGIAHSVEVWEKDQLVGGLYGVAIGQVFFGESMFSAVKNTSKLALIFLCRQLHAWDFKLIDCQVASPHLISMGAEEISRSDFVLTLNKLVNQQPSNQSWEATLTMRQLATNEY